MYGLKKCRSFYHRWLKNVALVERIFAAQPPVPACLTFISNKTRLYSSQGTTTISSKFSASKVVDACQPSMVVPKITDVFIKAALKSPNYEVVSSGLRYLDACLQKLQAAMDYVETDANWKKSIYTREERAEIVESLQESVSKCMPSVQYLVSVWNGKNIDTEEHSVANSDAMLNVFYLYQRMLPDAFACCSYDFTQLFSKVATAPDVRQTKNLALRAVDIVSFSRSKLCWFKKGGKNKQTSFYNLLKIVVDCGDKCVLDLFAKAMDLAVQVAVADDIVESCVHDDMYVWVEHLVRNQQSLHSEFLLKFFEEAASQVAKRTYKFNDKLNTLEKSLSSAPEAAASSPSLSETNQFSDEWWSQIPVLTLTCNDPTSENNETAEAAPASNAAAAVEVASSNHPASYLVVSMLEQLLALLENKSKNPVVSHAESVRIVDEYLAAALKDLYFLRVAQQDERIFAASVVELCKELPDCADLPALTTLRSTFEFLVGKSRGLNVCFGDAAADSVALLPWFCQTLKTCSAAEHKPIKFPYEVGKISVHVGKTDVKLTRTPPQELIQHKITPIHVQKIQRLILEHLLYISKLVDLQPDHEELKSSVESVFAIVTKLVSTLSGGSDVSEADVVAKYDLKIVSLLQPLFMSGADIPGLDTGIARIVADSEHKEVLKACCERSLEVLKQWQQAREEDDYESYNVNLKGFLEVLPLLGSGFTVEQLHEVSDF